MKKTQIAIIASLVAGFAVAAVGLRSLEPSTVSQPDQADAYFDPTADTEERIQALEAAVAAERNARQLLEEELLALYDEIDDLREDAAEPAPPAATEAVELPRTRFVRERTRTLSSGANREDALVEAGFTPDRAAWIVQREDELRLAAMQARFDAQRSGDPQAMAEAGALAANGMRNELGDLEYEQYLEGYGRPTTVGVGAVIESSPGQLAGLQSGDQIVRYDGERVFSYSDINAQQLQGEPGESIVIDILRNGTPMQIVMPRGPIGIQAGRFRGR